MRNTPTADDLNGPHPVKSQMQMYLEAYGTTGMTLLVQFVLNTPSIDAKTAAGTELVTALRKLESALEEASKLPENRK